jgi:hypothetical protein
VDWLPDADKTAIVGAFLIEELQQELVPLALQTVHTITMTPRFFGDLLLEDCHPLPDRGNIVSKSDHTASPPGQVLNDT